MTDELFSLRMVSQDSRGSIFELTQKDKLKIKILTLHKGLARGGHSHPYVEHFCVLSGEMEFHIGPTERERTAKYGSGERIRIDPGEPHYVLALSDSVFIELAREGRKYQEENYEPYRSLVLRLMNERR